MTLEVRPPRYTQATSSLFRIEPRKTTWFTTGPTVRYISMLYRHSHRHHFHTLDTFGISLFFSLSLSFFFLFLYLSNYFFSLPTVSLPSANNVDSIITPANDFYNLLVTSCSSTCLVEFSTKKESYSSLGTTPPTCDMACQRFRRISATRARKWRGLARS